MTAEPWVALVTGCSSGIGRALAAEMKSRGHRCFATARRDDSVEELTRAGFEALRLDVDDPGSIAAAVSEITGRAGRIDLLVNNAGFGLFGPLAEVPLARVRALFETNVLGALAVTQAVVPHMAARRRGRIVNVGSVVGVVGTPFAGAYCATKSALHMLSDVLRMEVAPFGIDVVVVQPGAVRSSVVEKSPSELERYDRDDSLYRTVSRYIERRSRASQADPMPSEEFARRTADAITAPRPPREVRIGNGVGYFTLLRTMPAKLRDRAFARRFGLDRLRT